MTSKRSLQTINVNLASMTTLKSNWWYDISNFLYIVAFNHVRTVLRLSLIARFMGPTWGPSGAGRTQVGPMLAPWTLLSGLFHQPLDCAWYHAISPSLTRWSHEWVPITRIVGQKCKVHYMKFFYGDIHVFISSLLIQDSIVIYD